MKHDNTEHAELIEIAGAVEQAKRDRRFVAAIRMVEGEEQRG